MFEFKRKKRVRRILYSKPALLLLLVLVLFLGRATFQIYQKERESRANLRQAETEVSALAARDIDLREKVERLQTESGMEAEIRSQFQVAKPGEKMVVMIDDDAEAPVESAQKQTMWGYVTAWFGRK